MAECSESTGLIWFSRTCALNSRCPPATTDSLLANASWEPALSAAIDGSRPMEPVMPFNTTFAPEPANGDDRIRTAGHADTLCAGLCESCLQRWNLGLIKHRGFGHMELCGLLRQQLDMCSARRQTGDGKSFRMTRDDVKSLGADGSGGSENDDSGVGGYAHCSFFVSSLFSVGNDRSGISESKLPPSGNSSGNESLESCLSCDG